MLLRVRSGEVAHAIGEFRREDAQTITNSHDGASADRRITGETAGILEAKQPCTLWNRALPLGTNRTDEADFFAAREQQRDMRARRIARNRVERNQRRCKRGEIVAGMRVRESSLHFGFRELPSRDRTCHHDRSVRGSREARHNGLERLGCRIGLRVERNDARFARVATCAVEDFERSIKFLD
jgi:hypothetical protein